MPLRFSTVLSRLPKLCGVDSFCTRGNCAGNLPGALADFDTSSDSR